MSELLRIRGKELTETVIAAIRSVIEKNPQGGRRQLSKEVCRQLGWYQPNGMPQDVACREIMLRLEKAGLIKLPPRKHVGRDNRARAVAAENLLPLVWEQEAVTGVLHDFGKVELRAVVKQEESVRWNGLIAQYHYLGYRPMVGRSMKYRVYLAGKEVGLIGWGSPCWKLASRDKYIGWEAAVREKNLQGVVNNTRFLIFPWVHVKYLASHVLSVAVKRVVVDWWTRYKVRLCLAETFVDSRRYKGTCYKAANWIYLGQSKGASKSGNSYQWHGEIKDVYAYPLCNDFMEKLKGESGCE
ncbi:MAG: Druantia anti-phage system protein DruA [bacterium]